MISRIDLSGRVASASHGIPRTRSELGGLVVLGEALLQQRHRRHPHRHQGAACDVGIFFVTFIPILIVSILGLSLFIPTAILSMKRSVIVFNEIIAFSNAGNSVGWVAVAWHCALVHAACKQVQPHVWTMRAVGCRVRV
jgi:hypothetical protein